MCGICGIFGFGDLGLAKRMNDSIAHRGPDGKGYFEGEGICLAHRRLAIIDLKAGDQPIFNEEGDMCIIYNGEVYNYLELRKTLAGKGHRFKTNSDTEVLLHAYEEWGIGSFEKFNGMFALAIWDGKKKKLVLARDRAGIKPLYYYSGKEGLLFASEPKAILQAEFVERKMDKGAFFEFLYLRYVMGEKSFFEGIKRLLPGHCMVVGKKGIEKIVKYWELPEPVGQMGEDEAARLVREGLDSAVKRHLISDVPVGVYLSGGIDSSLVCAAASRHCEGRLNTFCMGFGEEDDEFADARRIAELYKTNHGEKTIKASIMKDFPKMIYHADMPKRNLYPYYIAKEAAKHLKVMLSGLGGDELFCGYDYRYAHFEEEMKKGGKIGMPHLYVSTQSVDAKKTEGKMREICGREMKGFSVSGVEKNFEAHFGKGRDMQDGALRADFCTKMCDDFLFVEDATSMANSLESRVPFLDGELIDLAFSIPFSLKLRQGRGKYILRKAAKDMLPEQTWNKKKQGFSANTYSVFTSEIREIAKSCLPCGSAVREGLVRKEYIEAVLNKEPDMKLSEDYNVIWNLVAYETWHRIYMEGGRLFEPNFKLEDLI